MIIDVYKTSNSSNLMADETKKVSWNASQGIINEISNRRASANGFFINGQIKKAMNTLISIKQSVIQSFEEGDRTKLKEIELKFNKISNYLNNSSVYSLNKKVIEAHSSAMPLAMKFYSEYNDLLMDSLQEKGYLVGEQSDASRMRF